MGRRVTYTKEIRYRLARGGALSFVGSSVPVLERSA